MVLVVVMGGFDNLQNAIDTNAILMKLGTIEASVPLAEAQVQLALAGAQADITGQTMQQTIALQQQGFQGQLASMQGFCNLQSSIDGLSAQTAAGFGTVNANIERTGWQVSQTVMSEAEKNRALANQIDRENLNRLLAEKAALIAELSNERARESDRHGIEIQMTNNQYQTQAQLQQQNQNIGAITHLLGDVAQVARATSQAINIGSGTQTANPTTTANNVRA